MAASTKHLFQLICILISLSWVFNSTKPSHPSNQQSPFRIKLNTTAYVEGFQHYLLTNGQKIIFSITLTVTFSVGHISISKHRQKGRTRIRMRKSVRGSMEEVGWVCLFSVYYLYIFLQFLLCFYILRSKTMEGDEGGDVHHFEYSCDYSWLFYCLLFYAWYEKVLQCMIL